MLDHCPACDARIIGNEAYCRECAAPLSSGLPPTSVRLRSLIGARRLVLINSLVCSLPILMMIHAMPALVGAAIVISSGIVLMTAARRARYTNAVRLAQAQIAVAITWTAFLQVTFRYTPEMFPLTVPLMLVALVTFYLSSLWVWQQHSARDLRLQCDACGYWLTGQITPRCPECGTAFDPVRLR